MTRSLIDEVLKVQVDGATPNVTLYIFIGGFRERACARWRVCRQA